MLTPNINLGTLSAEEDNNFSQHFIETKYLRRITSHESDIIYGAKGVGKTALRRALTEFKTDLYLTSITIDLANISFEGVHHRLSALTSMSYTEISILARTTWLTIMISYGLLAFSDTLSNGILKKKILNVLVEDGFIEKTDIETSPDSYLQILNTIENIFQKIVSVPVFKEKTLINITPEQQHIISKFPVNEKMSEIINETVEAIKKSSKKILICLDGFDSIVDHSKESRRTILAGLIDAIFKIRLNPKISDAFCFKAFLPHELTADAKATAWDSDKHANNIHYLSWNEEDFKIFLEKRMNTHSKKRSSKFVDIWSEFMPDKVINNVHNVEENTFEYILRHTLYRPRQVLSHVQNIFKLWSEQTSGPDKVPPSFIPQAVARNNILMADKVADQLSLIYPNIVGFLKSWQGSPMIIESVKFRDKIRRVFKDLTFSEVDKIFDDLFDFGIFGVYSKVPKDNNTKRLKYRFSFIGDDFSTHIHNSIEDSDLIAFSPMFREYCGCISTLDGVIYPIAMNNFDI